MHQILFPLIEVRWNGNIQSRAYMIAFDMINLTSFIFFNIINCLIIKVYEEEKYKEEGKHFSHGFA